MVHFIVFTLLITVFYISSMLRESYIYRKYGYSEDAISRILKAIAYVFIVWSFGDLLVFFMEQI